MTVFVEQLKPVASKNLTSISCFVESKYAEVT